MSAHVESRSPVMELKSILGLAEEPVSEAATSNTWGVFTKAFRSALGSFTALPNFAEKVVDEEGVWKRLRQELLALNDSELSSIQKKLAGADAEAAILVDMVKFALARSGLNPAKELEDITKSRKTMNGVSQESKVRALNLDRELAEDPQIAVKFEKGLGGVLDPLPVFQRKVLELGLPKEGRILTLVEAAVRTGDIAAHTEAYSVLEAKAAPVVSPDGAPSKPRADSSSSDVSGEPTTDSVASAGSTPSTVFPLVAASMQTVGPVSADGAPSQFSSPYSLRPGEGAKVYSRIRDRVFKKEMSRKVKQTPNSIQEASGFSKLDISMSNVDEQIQRTLQTIPTERSVLVQDQPAAQVAPNSPFSSGNEALSPQTVAAGGADQSSLPREESVSVVQAAPTVSPVASPVSLSEKSSPLNISVMSNASQELKPLPVEEFVPSSPKSSVLVQAASNSSEVKPAAQVASNSAPTHSFLHAIDESNHGTSAIHNAFVNERTSLLAELERVGRQKGKGKTSVMAPVVGLSHNQTASGIDISVTSNVEEVLKIGTPEGEVRVSPSRQESALVRQPAAQTTPNSPSTVLPVSHPDDAPQGSKTKKQRKEVRLPSEVEAKAFDIRAVRDKKGQVAKVTEEEKRKAGFGFFSPQELHEIKEEEIRLIMGGRRRAANGPVSVNRHPEVGEAKSVEWADLKKRMDLLNQQYEELLEMQKFIKGSGDKSDLERFKLMKLDLLKKLDEFNNEFRVSKVKSFSQWQQLHPYLKPDVEARVLLNLLNSNKNPPQVVLRVLENLVLSGNTRILESKNLKGFFDPENFQYFVDNKAKIFQKIECKPGLLKAALQEQGTLVYEIFHGTRNTWRNLWGWLPKFLTRKPSETHGSLKKLRERFNNPLVLKREGSEQKQQPQVQQPQVQQLQGESLTTTSQGQLPPDATPAGVQPLISKVDQDVKSNPPVMIENSPNGVVSPLPSITTDTGRAAPAAPPPPKPLGSDSKVHPSNAFVVLTKEEHSTMNGEETLQRGKSIEEDFSANE